MPLLTRKPKRLSFTKQSIEKLLAPEDGRRYIYDLRTPGLALCVSAAGGKVFYLYRKIDGKPERIKIGEWPETTLDHARDEAARMNGRIADGQNPNDKRRVNRHAPTLGQVFDEYIEAPTRGKSKRPRSPKTIYDYKLQFKAHLEPWRERQLSKIKRSDVEKLHNQIGSGHGEYQANRVLALVKAIFNYSIEQEYFPLNPAARLRAFGERSRERFLTADELPKFWAAVEVEPTADFFKFALLTGARSGNAKAARWADINLEAATWTIPLTKGGKPLTIPLSPEAVTLLKARREQLDGEWVFPSRAGNRAMPMPRHAWERIVKRAGLAEHLRLHDLRRSLGSWQAIGGSSETVIGKSLGHSSIQATKIYARVDLQAVRQSVESATAAMMAAVTAEQSKADEKRPVRKPARPKNPRKNKA